MKKTKKLILCVTSLFLLSSCGSESGVTLEKSKDIVNPNIIQSDSSNIDTNKSSSSIPPTPVIEKRTLTFKSAVVKGNGDIVPVANSTFIFRKYNFHTLLSEYIIKNNLIMPNINQSKYIGKCDLYFHENKSVCDLDHANFSKDLINWYTTNAPKFKDEQIKASNNTNPIIIKTDLAGNADINLEDGKWYVTGSYLNSINYVSWESVPLDISKDTKKIEFSNDTAKIVASYISSPIGEQSYLDRVNYNNKYTDLFTILGLFEFESLTKNN